MKITSNHFGYRSARKEGKWKTSQLEQFQSTRQSRNKNRTEVKQNINKTFKLEVKSVSNKGILP